MVDLRKNALGFDLRAGRMLLGLLVAISSWAVGAANFAVAAEVWHVGTWKTAQTIQPFLYEKYATPANPGLQVEVRPFTNPADQKSALLAGSLDMTGTTLALAIQAASRGEPVWLVAALGNKCSALVVAKDSPIKNTADLRGKRNAFTLSYKNFNLTKFENDLLWSECFATHLMPSMAPPYTNFLGGPVFWGQVKGNVDAFLSGEPFPTQAVMQGYGRILAYPYYGDSIGTINSGMLMREDFIQVHPEQALRMVAAHKAATEALTADRKLWLDTAANLFGVDRNLLQASADNIELAWDMDDVFMRRLAALGARMKELGIIKQEPDYNKLVDRSFVNALRTNTSKHD